MRVFEAYKSQPLFSDKLLIFTFISLSVLFAGIIVGSVYTELIIYIVPAIVGIIVFYFALINSKFWLYTLLALSGVFFHSASDGISVLDVILALYFIGSIFVWFFHRLFIVRKKVVENIGDWLILAFFLFIPLNLVMVLLNDADPELWLREAMMMSILLIYFPIRDVVRKELDIKKFLIVFALIIAGVGIFQLYDYYLRVTVRMVYAYELIHSMNTNQTLYTAASLVGLIFLITTDSIRIRLISVIFTAMSVAFLFSTFSRTFWLILVLSTFIIFLIVPNRKKIRMFFSVAILLTFLGSAAFLLMRDNVTLLFEASKKRLMSSTKVGEDISLRSRIIEWEKVGALISEYPLGGNGLGKYFHFYEPITMQTKRTAIIHNGYLYLTYRLGIPMSLFFFGFVIFYLFKAFNLLNRTKNDFEKSLVYSIIGVFFSLLLSNYTSSQFFYRDGIFVTATIISLICILERIINQNKLSESAVNAN